MPLDGSFIACLCQELQQMVDCHIDKIHIPTKNEFVFSVRGRGFSKKLLISLAPDGPRVCFTNAVFENPANPPMICMLLRKHLASGRILAVEGFGAERVLRMRVLSTNEMGDRVPVSLIMEFFGPKTNLILTDENDRIYDAARRSNMEAGDRLLQPGAHYSLPANQQKTDFLLGDLSKAVTAITDQPDRRLADALLDKIAGISPLLCREAAFVLQGDCEAPVCRVKAADLLAYLEELKQKVLCGGSPTLLLKKDNTPFDFTFFEITQYGTEILCQPVTSFSELLETFYGERDRKRRLDHLRTDLIKRIKNAIARNARKMELRKAEQKKSANREHLRIYGELLKANLYRLEKGAHKAVVENYYDPTGKKVEIPLNTALSPAANAAKYFKDYKKACNAEQTLGTFIKECETEGEYLESVLFSLQTADNTAELEQIRAELITGGYVSWKQKKTKTKINAKPLRFSKNGFIILVGRNNLQNDELTTKTAAKNDIWFHTKAIHGSHVILKTEGKIPDDETLSYAAHLASYYSKAKNSHQVAVDYTPVKFVKKPSGAKPGMVIYSTNKTIYANPNEICKKDDTNFLPN